MRFNLLLMLFLLSLIAVSGQTAPGAPDESKIAILQPDAADIELASKQGLQVFKILRRDTIDFEKNEYDLRGGGAYYSFVTRSHSYDRTPQIELQQGDLKTGFAGANYGFLKDLGKMDLTAVDNRMREVAFLEGYQPPKYEPDVREEKKRSSDYSVEGITYKRRLEAVSGHTYILRAILFNRADSLVAFNINRINEDGSMVIFWKPLREFKVPVKFPYRDSEIKAKVDEILKDPKYATVSAEVNDNKITLRGSVVDAEYTNLIRRVMEVRSSGVTNQVMKKR